MYKIVEENLMRKCMKTRRDTALQ